MLSFLSWMIAPARGCRLSRASALSRANRDYVTTSYTPPATCTTDPGPLAADSNGLRTFHGRIQACFANRPVHLIMMYRSRVAPYLAGQRRGEKGMITRWEES
jgi:hypothetical protein